MVRQVRFFQANIGNTFPMMYGIDLNRGSAIAVHEIVSEIFIIPSARAILSQFSKAVVTNETIK